MWRKQGRRSLDHLEEGRGGGARGVRVASRSAHRLLLQVPSRDAGHLARGSRCVCACLTRRASVRNDTIFCELQVSILSVKRMHVAQTLHGLLSVSEKHHVSENFYTARRAPEFFLLGEILCCFLLQSNSELQLRST